MSDEKPHDGHDSSAQAPDADPLAQISKLEGRITDLEEKWHRTAAELDDTRKRLARDLAYGRAEARTRLATQWLPVLDDLDHVLTHADVEPEAILAEVHAVRERALGVLARLGFPRQEVKEGTTFDPIRHEAVATVPGTPSEEPSDGTVVDVVRPGYGDPEHLLRPAAVVVAARAD